MDKIKSMVRLRANLIMALIVVALLWFLSLILTGCYSVKKAKVQHGKAVSTYPEIGADYCARIYPCVPELVNSDTTVVYDTLWGACTIDTVVTIGRDTVYFEVIKIIPKTVTKVVTIRDTVQVTNSAELDLALIQVRTLTEKVNSLQSQKDKYQRQARHRLYYLIGISAAGLLWLFLFIRRKGLIK